MQEKLLTAREVSHLLGISESKVIELAKETVLPSYKIEGEFLRFKKDEILAVKKEIQKQYKIEHRVSLSEKIKDFIYFNDFYIASAFIIATLLWLIFRE